MPHGIDGAGRVVGQADAPDGGGRRAFLWEAGALTDLNTLIPAGTGWTLMSAYAINDAGQITGTGTLGGRTRAFLLNPVGGPGQDRSVRVLLPDVLRNAASR